mmetsp:Transcript_10711/g.7499  ORF Transcript_10711/g.7499 Transcript_10711/m.7499 type:complete len:91 (+) Transcript_10711:36-308(+)|eukprot:CAMPEP_0116872452 /NCGR_PEP_ID=MMETSP0463-20121206/3208_1 /TAXON_ID=181622 /ORGANISM="Strombidinopsis sp, Strain SopsisLIS2011" /LENGTH=90 /DNA_ID=CAMNT_0004512699 /DNA_START=25 /DNA_END=297 /DNA_ORIENTATION=+
MAKIHMHVVDMDKEHIELCQKHIEEAFENHREEKQIANKVRALLDKEIGESWNVVVGKNFGSHVVHQTKSYMFCSYGEDGEVSLLLWKSG